MKKALFAAVSLLAAAAFGDTPPKSKAHGLSVTGTIVSIDGTAMKMTVKTAAGKHVPLVWTGATKTAGGAVKSGVKVTVRYLEKDGKNIATSIRVETTEPLAASGSAPPAAATPTVTASASPRSR